ncbi:hypothetical protein [Pseudomonas sp. RL_15y_Pfl2_60]|uniref:hypothetical protein n=1 Tax=Pseudomonas sp. RL_15y_Pfl2_60 TaxID=3088709 RepID=UPI0030D742CB
MTTYQRALIRANNGCNEVLGAYLCEALDDVSSMVGCRAFTVEADPRLSASWMLSATWESPEAMRAFTGSEQLAQVLSHALQQGWIQEINCNAP